MSSSNTDPTKAPQFGKRQASSSHASRVMSRNRKKDTKPERLLRSELWHRGLRYRLHVGDLPGCPDLVFQREKVAVFCDGDYWHGKNWEERKRRLAKGSNPDYWIPKIKSNIVRDRRNDDELAALGWIVIRCWESDIKKRLSEVADQVEEVVRSARRPGMFG